MTATTPTAKSASPTRATEFKVFITKGAATCDDCKEALGTKAWILLAGDKGVLCLVCADLAHLNFLPSGDAALTRRARKQSVLSAVVLKWNRARKRYERQGLLVEEKALQDAESECLADADLRARSRERQELRRAELDEEFVSRFAARIRALLPSCPAHREQDIAEHACLKYSGRVGRSEAAKQLDERAASLAVEAHIRHRETKYDRLLARGIERNEARARVRAEVDKILECWRGSLRTDRGAQ